MNRLITKLIRRNGFSDNIYVRQHLKHIIEGQEKIKNLFRLKRGIWDWCMRGDKIDLTRLDKKGYKWTN